jgi:hypothetical protein
VTSTTLHVQGREVTVPMTPAARSTATFCTMALDLPRPGYLVLRPTLLTRVLRGIILTVGVGLLVWAGFRFASGDNFWAAGLTMGGVAFLAVGALWGLGEGHYLFDRIEGRLLRRSFGGTQTRQLADVLAVQVLNGKPSSGGRTWELNLVMDDEELRWNLACHTDLHAILRLAWQIAEFLGLPLLDHVPQEKQVALQGREVAVPLTPLPATAAASFRTMTLVQLTPDCLVLRPSFGTRLFASLLAGVGVMVGVLAAYQALQRELCATAFFVVFALTFTGVGLCAWLWTGRFEFDRGTGRLTRKRGLRQTALPLTNILAVQCLYVYHTGETDYSAWQLNLVLDDPGEARWNLSDHANRQATLDHAHLLAEFLAVPLLDHSQPR